MAHSLGAQFIAQDTAGEYAPTGSTQAGLRDTFYDGYFAIKVNQGFVDNGWE